MKYSINGMYRSLVGIILTVFYTVKYNWFYILLSVLAPLAIYKMGAGREVISLLFESSGLVWNTLGLMLSLALMSATIWLIPSLSVYIIAAYARIVAKIPLDRKLIFFKHMIHMYSSSSSNPINGGHNQVPARYLAMLPWTMVCATLIQFSFGSESMNASIGVFVSLNTLLFCLLVVIDGRRTGNKRFYYWALGFAAIAVICLFLVCSRCSTNLQSWLSLWKVICIVSTYVIAMVITFLLLIRGDVMYKDASAATDDTVLERLLRRNNRTHGILFLVTFGTLIVFTYLALHLKLPAVSSLTVLLLCLNFYMLFVDSLFTAQAVMTAKLDQLRGNGSKVAVVSYKILIGFLFCGCIWLVFFKNTNNYKHTLTVNKELRSDSLESYFEKWRRQKMSNMEDSNRTMNVYLISGQGGGSRAAVYILAVLHEIEASRDKELYKQTFSISTISGSSAGIGQYIGQHEYVKLRDYLKEDKTARPFEQIKEVYVYNFFNSNLLGLLFYDRIPVWIKNIMYPVESNTYASFNRNYIQEREERMQLINFTKHFLPRDTFSYSFLQDNIQDLYAGKEGEELFSKPLVFFNTTVMNQGRKGVFCPLSNAGNLFVNNVDLLEDDKPVSFHFAELTSQSFPLLNNFSRYGQNYFGDGGLYENSGTSTTLQIYKRLRKYCDKHKYKVRFVLLNILNAKDDKGKDTLGGKLVLPEPCSRDESSIANLLLSAVGQIPFAGHEKDAKMSVVDEVAVNNLYSTDSLIKDYAYSIQPEEKFALTRVFSRRTLNRFIDQTQLDGQLNNYTRDRRTWDSIDDLVAHAAAGKELTLTAGGKIYRVYTQYRREEDKEMVKGLLGSIKDMVTNLPPIDLVKKVEYSNEIRYFHKEDAVLATRLAKRIVETQGLNFKLVYVSDTTLAGKTPPEQLELWIDKLDMSMPAR